MEGKEMNRMAIGLMGVFIFFVNTAASASEVYTKEFTWYSNHFGNNIDQRNEVHKGKSINLDFNTRGNLKKTASFLTYNDSFGNEESAFIVANKYSFEKSSHIGLAYGFTHKKFSGDGKRKAVPVIALTAGYNKKIMFMDKKIKIEVDVMYIPGVKINNKKTPSVNGVNMTAKF